MSNIMKSVLFTTSLLALIVMLPVNKLSAETDHNDFVIAGCSDWKPYCYKESDRMLGSHFDISKQVLDEAGIKYAFDVYPWVRVYHMGKHEENFLVLGLGRTEKREDLFKWIAPLKKAANIHAYQLASSDINVTNTDDLKHYNIAVERGSYTQEYLRKHGHDEVKIIEVSRYNQLFNVLLHKRADFFLLDDAAFIPEIKRNGFNLESFKRSILVFKVTEYLATSKYTSDRLVEKMKASYEKLIKKGKIKLPD